MTETTQDPIDDTLPRAGVLDDREEWAISEEQYAALLAEPEPEP
jgi:hypothetical protein